MLDENGAPIAADDELEGAAVNRTTTEQDGGGFDCKRTSRATLRGRENQFTIGLAHDEGDVEFGSSTELGALDATRQAVAGGVFVGEAFTGLEASTSSTGFYLSNTFTLGDAHRAHRVGTLQPHARRARGPDRRRLDGDHKFERFNPASA